MFPFHRLGPLTCHRCIGAYMCFRLAGNNASASKWRYRARDLVKTCYGTDSALYRETFGSGSDQII